MIIKDMFEKSIDRDIKSVIKADEIDKNIIKNELEEYVITNKLISHFNTFFENYAEAIDNKTDNVGVWISGFFGSGKSHFLKILSYILNTNLKLNGMSAADVLINSGKIREKSIINNINKSLSVNNDAILMNISSKAYKDSSILDIFYNQFNGIRGYSNSLPFLANLEKRLDNQNLYEIFKNEFEKINGNPWVNIREKFTEISDDIIIALSKVGFMSEDEAIRWVENPNLDFYLTIESFSIEINEYCEKRGNNHHIVFFVDEIGQFVSNNSKLMLELQTIVENFATICSGKAWVVVTSQQSFDDMIYGYDFSKIQGRFYTRLSLSSAHVDEVIQKRILEKNKEAEQTLELNYDKSEGSLKNLLIFKDSVELNPFSDYKEFIDFYPFIPYQFDIMQKSLSLIRKNSTSGRDMSEGERSMIKIFNDSLIKSSNENDSFLVPLSYFYDSIQNDIDQDYVSIIENANKKNFFDAFDIELLKTLFLIKFLKDDFLYPSLENISILMITDINEDKLALNKKVSISLKKLIKETLVHKKGEKYYFLSDKEQDINREIKEEFIDIPDILTETHNIIFDELLNKKNKFKLNNRYDFKFDRIIDKKQKRNNEIAIRVLSPFFEDESDQTNLDGSTFVLTNHPNDEIIVDLRNEINIFNEIQENLQIKSYLDKKGVDLSSKLKCEKQEEYFERFDNIKENFNDIIINSKIQINGNFIEISETNIEQFFDISLEKLVNEVYYKLNLLNFEPESKDIENAIKNELYDDESRCIGALDDLKNYILETSNTTLEMVYSKYFKAPYGYNKNDIAWLIITLFSKKKISLFINEQELLLNENNAQKIVNTIKNYNSIEAKNLILRNRDEIPKKYIKTVKNIFEELFNKSLTYNNEEKLMYEFNSHIRSEKDEIENYFYIIQQNKSYPGLNILKSNYKLFDKILKKSSLNDFYYYVTMNETQLYDNFDELEEVYGFFNGPQKDIFDKSYELYNIYLDNKIAINNPEIDTISNQISNIINDDSPFDKINKLTNLNNKFDESFKIILNNEIEPISNQIKKDRNDLLNLLNSNNLDLKNEIEYEYGDLLVKLRLYTNIRRIQGVRQDSLDLKNNFEELILKNEIHNSVIINLKNMFDEEIEIDNEENMEKFLNKIRKNVKDGLNKKTIVKIRL